jgi:hypothetical protein
MSGRYLKLRPGRYVLSVPGGSGPAGVHRATGGEVAVDRHGGELIFEVPAEERVYFWWRGAHEPAGLELSGPGPRPRSARQRRSPRGGRARTDRQEGPEWRERLEHTPGGDMGQVAP